MHAPLASLPISVTLLALLLSAGLAEANGIKVHSGTLACGGNHFANHISGESVTIPVDSIIALETREISIGKTTLLAGGTLGVAFILFLALIAPVVFLAPG